VKLKQVLEDARDALRDGGNDEAALEGEILLRHIMRIDRARLFSRLDEEISPRQETALHRALARRLNGEPTAYITGHREFYGLDFIINRQVLIPRPESELLVAEAIALAGKKKVEQIADIGTGSGAIAVSLAVNLPDVTVYATDISARALRVAAKNCRKHAVAGRVALLKGDMLGPLPGPVDLIVANLPYVRESDLPAGGPLGYEPPLALDGGRDGLDRISVLCQQAGGSLRPGGCLMLEIGQGQAKSVSAMLRQRFPAAAIEVNRDLAGIERVVSLRLTQGSIFC
jgi:release factor glutamine methyltransferase